MGRHRPIVLSAVLDFIFKFSTRGIKGPTVDNSKTNSYIVLSLDFFFKPDLAISKEPFLRFTMGAPPVVTCSVWGTEPFLIDFIAMFCNIVKVP